jgi:1-acyl-sn-glycerol-3-phosphate acyltransferase
MAEVIPITREPEDVPDRCRALTRSGRRCRNRAIGTDGTCRVHRRRRPEASAEDRLGELLEFVRRRLTGEYWVGMENVPSEGPVLLVSNHAGTVPWDAIVMKFGMLDHHPAHRHVRLLAADLAFHVPFVGALARKSGNTLACAEDAYRLLAAGQVLGVFPEGFKGVGKHFRDRYKLQRFGRGGFIEIALRARCPIVPVSIVGSEEIYPLIHNAKTLARLFGFPYFPITPFFPWLGPLGAIPLPSKWIVEFGEPIATEGFDEAAWQDPVTVFEMTDRVREEIQQSLHRNLMVRRSVFY